MTGEVIGLLLILGTFFWMNHEHAKEVRRLEDRILDLKGELNEIKRP